MDDKNKSQVYDQFLQNDLGNPFRPEDNKVDQAREEDRVFHTTESASEPGQDGIDTDFQFGEGHEARLADNKRKNSTEHHRCNGDVCKDKQE